MTSVSQVDRSADFEANERLDEDELAWLRERLDEYRELLEYLHDH